MLIAQLKTKLIESEQSNKNLQIMMGDTKRVTKNLDDKNMTVVNL